MFLAVLMLSVVFSAIPASFSEEESSISNKPCAGMTVKKCQKKESEKLKECKICGLINEKGISPSIIEGKVVKPPYLYPWMVSLITGGRKTCGGAIISKDYILTAAHCVAKYYLAAMVGSINPDSINIGFLTKTHELKEEEGMVEKVIHHPKFSHENMRHDIALIKLKKPITCDMYKNPICLPPANSTVSRDTHLYITGWGASYVDQDYSKKYPDKLLMGQVKKTPYSRCKAESKEPIDLEDTSYCFKGLYKQRPCFGDSGGTAFMSYKKNQYTSIGVASMHTSLRCAEGKPFLYTSVSHYIPWIYEVTSLSPEPKTISSNCQLRSRPGPFVRVQLKPS